MRRTWSAVVVAGVMLGALACGEAVAPSATARRLAGPSADVLPNTHRDNGSSALVRCEAHGASSASAWIGASGGHIVAGDVRLIVPPGALTKKTYITATVPAGPYAFVSFQPHGLTFKKPAALIFDASECNVPGWYPPDVVYIENGAVVEEIDAILIPYLQLVAAPIDHFSGYALAW